MNNIVPDAEQGTCYYTCVYTCCLTMFIIYIYIGHIPLIMSAVNTIMYTKYKIIVHEVYDFRRTGDDYSLPPPVI